MWKGIKSESAVVIQDKYIGSSYIGSKYIGR